jgi:hypothetical protein
VVEWRGLLEKEEKMGGKAITTVAVFFDPDIGILF